MSRQSLRSLRRQPRVYTLLLLILAVIHTFLAAPVHPITIPGTTSTAITTSAVVAGGCALFVYAGVGFDASACAFG